MVQFGFLYPLKHGCGSLSSLKLEIYARKISQQTGLSYPTAHKACQVIRMALTAADDGFWLSGEVEIDKLHSGGQVAKGKRGRRALQERFLSSVSSRDMEK